MVFAGLYPVEGSKYAELREALEKLPFEPFALKLADGRSTPLTDGLSDALDPVFDASGKYLYFFASTDAGPSNQWFAQSNSDMRSQRSPIIHGWNRLPHGTTSRHRAPRWQPGTC